MARNLPENAAHFHDHGLYLPTRTMYIDGEKGDDGFELTSESVRRDIKNILTLDSIGTGDINIILNCNGGNTILGMAIYDAIKACKSFVRITVYGKAYSMGSVILQAADERVMAPHAIMMIHDGERTYEGHKNMVKNEVKLDNHVDDIQESIYLEAIKKKKPRYTKEQLQKLLTHDTFITAKEAVEMGLADKVLG